MREQTLTTAEARLIVPETYRQMQRWDAPELAEFVDRLNNGDSSIGWEGDPRLVLYQEGPDTPGPEGKRWVIYRLEADGSLRGVIRSKPGVRLDTGLIKYLMERDARRGHDPVALVDSDS